MVTQTSRLRLLAHRGTGAMVAFRSYLRLLNADHRRALTRLLAGEHPLGVQTGRTRRIAREDRGCRFCAKRGSVEDEEHVLLCCDGNAELLELRRVWREDALMRTGRVELPGHSRTLATLLWGLSERKVAAAFGRFVFEVFALCDRTAMVR
ncbi:hypothetical protein CERSUDRAFT_113069 [Gelatoporia subvermispora B]|uniref:Reverse transcriptase zinc-binding domain-containing protein n=1 Tax=Ceriporiopsis subvermispora (strain B) TaxID=914234 RepID=M2R4F9_CERS8|nr:hypothetical protein CERSUDRAFT_113069 [Gelatoporia subvermispora B]